MIRINESYLDLKASYLFSEIAKRVTNFQNANPDISIIKLGIGDVTKPLPRVCIDAFHKAIEEMGSEETFKGYGPEQGYAFLREKIASEDFQSRGAPISADEVFVSDGSKCDTGNFQELFAKDISIGVPDPVYPVYVDTNVMAGRAGHSENGRYSRLIYLDSTEENGFVPAPPEKKLDLIYLCFPNNPTGATATRQQLQAWVDYARENRALILYDAAYVAFIRDGLLPLSIYELKGANEVAVEFRSFSKTAGFTGMRCAYTVVPKACRIYDCDGKSHSLHAHWNRRHTTKFNGVSYPVQRAAEATYSPAGKSATASLTDYYLENAAIIKEKLEAMGFKCVGGENSPYIWTNCKMGSWEFFDKLLKDAGVVSTPGAGFGLSGEGFVRFSAFNSRERVTLAMERIGKLF